MPERLVIFGVGGDLAGRFLLPALAELEALESLPDGLAIVGTGRDDWDDEQLRSYAAEQLAEDSGGGIAGDVRDRLLQRLRYRRADVSEADDVRQAVADAERVVAYLALPPSLFESTIETLGRATGGERTTVVVEKPFGTDLASAQQLNRALARHFAEDSVIRVDHFLHLNAARNLMALRFANRLLEPVWNAEHIAAVEITWDETLALEGRAGYYDDAGALRDMLQNHLLQLMCLVALEQPASASGGDVRARRLEVLRHVPTLSPDEVAERTVRARYSAGRVDDRDVPAYAEEEGVEPARETETFAQVALHVDSPRWAGVPFTLRSGKALAEDRYEVVVRFRAPPGPSPGDGAPVPNILRLGIEPDTLELQLAALGPIPGEPPAAARLKQELGEQQLSAYASLLRDALEGRNDWSVGADEAEESWRIFQPVIDSWQAGRPPLLEYEAGSAGPSEAEKR